jgi:hypothetical protein
MYITVVNQQQWSKARVWRSGIAGRSAVYISSAKGFKDVWMQCFTAISHDADSLWRGGDAYWKVYLETVVVSQA